MAVIIPNVVNWSVTPQNGQEDYFTKMNIWLSESTNVIASLSTAITKINESNSESNDNLEEVLTARDQTVAARNEAVTAVATLTAGAIDDTTIASNKAFSNEHIIDNYYDKDAVDSKTIINDFADKPTPIDTDHIGIQEDEGLFKKLSWANLKATLKTYFDTLYDNWVANDSRAKTALNASGEAPIYACRAWVNFNGTGTVAIRASGNVSSITDNGVGNYTVNFTTAMPDSNYVQSVLVEPSLTDVSIKGAGSHRQGNKLTTSTTIGTATYNDDVFSDFVSISVSIFR